MDGPVVSGNLIVLLANLLLVVLIVAAAIIVFKRQKNKRMAAQPVLSQQATEHYSIPQNSSVTTNIKRCPTCQSTFTDETLQFCVLDGGPLESVGGTTGRDPDETVTRIRNL